MAEAAKKILNVISLKRTYRKIFVKVQTDKEICH